MERKRPEKKHILLGVTGGIATGKTTVARMLEDLGAKTIDFDVLSREVVMPGKPALRDIEAHFGREVLKPDGTLDRRKLAEIVFHDPAERKTLEEFTHVRIFQEYLRQVDEFVSRDPQGIIQGIVPLLIEVHLQRFFDKILLVYTPEEIQIERLVRRDGISRETAVRILEAQMPIEEKKSYADYIIDNSGPLETIKDQVADLWNELKQLRA